jgi:hypothetical protein
VAFAATACLEHNLYVSQGNGPLDHSEQFLYWAIKTKTADSSPTADGTHLEFARDALTSEGICLEVEWPYDQNNISGNVSHGGPNTPSATVVASAAGNKHTGSTYQIFNAPGYGAAAVLTALESGRPVAISLPVFKDPHVRRAVDNWNTPVAWLYGRVLNPPPTAVVDGGHAVCVTGFVPDAGEPKGGYFIFRNSWSTKNLYAK